MFLCMNALLTIFCANKKHSSMKTRRSAASSGGEASTPAKTPSKKASGVFSPPPREKNNMLNKMVRSQEMYGNLLTPTPMFNDNPESFGQPNSEERKWWTGTWHNILGKDKSVTKYYEKYIKDTDIVPHQKTLDAMAKEQLAKATGTTQGESRAPTQDIGNVFDAVGGKRDGVDEEDVSDSLAAMKIDELPKGNTAFQVLAAKRDENPEFWEMVGKHCGTDIIMEADIADQSMQLQILEHYNGASGVRPQIMQITEAKLKELGQACFAPFHFSLCSVKYNGLAVQSWVILHGGNPSTVEETEVTVPSTVPMILTGFRRHIVMVKVPVFLDNKTKLIQNALKKSLTHVEEPDLETNMKSELLAPVTRDPARKYKHFCLVFLDTQLDNSILPCSDNEGVHLDMEFVYNGNYDKNKYDVKLYEAYGKYRIAVADEKKLFQDTRKVKKAEGGFGALG